MNQWGKDENIYFDMIDSSKVSSAQQAVNNAEKLKRIEDFRMQQQLNSPVYKKLLEQNDLLQNQLKELEKQNVLLSNQIESTRKSEKEAKAQAKKSKIFAYVSFAVGTLIGIVGLLIALFK